MCGLAGFWAPGTKSAENAARAERMAGQLGHRGPDDAGTWCDAQSGFAVSHRRLSIIDLSASGHQPMISASGRWVLAYNGEIYNHLQLRQRLDEEGDAPAWRGHSDTETLLACIDAWGVDIALERSVGMFAFALWDQQDRSLILARDRMGEKPLYYGRQGDTFLFASELKALRVHPAFRAEVNRDSLTLLLRHNCIPAPHSIYQDIFKLLPGHVMRVSFDDAVNARLTSSAPYWTLNDTVEAGLRNPFSGDITEATDALEQQLSASIGAQMLADVPLGAFLSGGVDSSSVVALMQAQSDRPIRTFTIGFSEDNYDEAADARAVAEHLQTEHTELYVSPSDAQAVIPSLPSVYCEPFSDSSQIPTFLVSQMARQHVTVALSGDGGDELFGGYNRYLMARGAWSKAQKLPPFARSAVAGVLGGLRPSTWDRAFDVIKPLLPTRMQVTSPGEKAHKLASVLNLPDSHAYFRQLTSHWTNPARVVIDAREPDTRLTDSSAWPEVDCFEHWMMAMDAQTYMPDDILVKVDRAAMANSLETRVPMLDHRVVELAWRLPLDLNLREGRGKWLLRQVLYRHVPKEMIERPKMGFAIPLDSWLRGPLRDWAEALLNEKRLLAEGFLNPAPIRAMWEEHLGKKRNWQHHLWTILMYQAWLEDQRQS
jgi:asparagine synthase (glutamine-hydrolysing)